MSDIPHTPSLRNLFALWLRIGATSFGGGSATQLLIQRHFVEQQRWLTPEDFSQVWAVVQFAPGINLLAIAVVIGKKLGGTRGAFVSALGMLLPSVGITIAMTALYVLVKDQPRIAGALHGITPALVGLSIAFTWRLLKPPVEALRAHGRAPMMLGLIVIGATLAMTLLGVPVLISYLLGAAALGIFYARA
ncbi:MAG: chromate transporter [Chloroflexi bacterium]|nr:chromate transporter [Chloroflexota bacterium]